MFRLMCPECGRDIAPTEKECPNCDASAPAPVQERVMHTSVEPATSPFHISESTVDFCNDMAPLLPCVPSAPADEPSRRGESPSTELPAPRLPLPMAGLASVPVSTIAVRPVSPFPQPLRVFLPKQIWRQLVQPIRVPWIAPEPVALTMPAAAMLTMHLRVHPLRMTPARLPKPRLHTLGPRTPEIESGGLSACAAVPEPGLSTQLFELQVGGAKCETKLPVPASARFSAAVVVPASILRMELASPLPLCELTSYIVAAGRLMRHNVNTPQPNAVQSVPIFMVPGPMLSPGLQSFMDRALRPVFPGKLVPKTQWPIRLGGMLLAGTLLSAGVSNFFSVAHKPARVAKAVTHTAQQQDSQPVQTSPLQAETQPLVPPATQPAPIAEPTILPANSLARAIEVSGFRLEQTADKRQEIHYMVVNHSQARLSGLTVYVSLRAADARVGQPPLCQFSFVTPDVGPYEAKPMASTIDGMRKQLTLPEWQDVRADLQISQ